MAQSAKKPPRKTTDSGIGRKPGQARFSPTSATVAEPIETVSGTRSCEVANRHQRR